MRTGSSAGQVLPLYPRTSSAAPRSVRGLYLDPQLPLLAAAAARGGERPLIYANFVSSLDGRIALGGDEAQAHVPRTLTTPADWRLFQELQAHADCFITHGGYLRSLAAGRLSDILQVGLRKESADLLAWRHAQGLTRQPAVIVVSHSLDFVLPPSLAQHGQRVAVVTTRDASTQRIERLRTQGIEVIVAAEPRQVGGRALMDVVHRLGCRRAYLEAGPTVLGAMLREGLLGRLYLTLGHRLLGGDAFHTLLNGSPLGGEGALRLEQLYLLSEDGDRDGQFFASFSPLD